jgi:uncharacterized protein YbjT (DUF2867 family)
MSGLTMVIGGTGKTGRRVADRLRARGVRVRIGSRSAAPRFDWEEPGTWAPALQGVEAAYVSYYPDVAMPGAWERVAALARTAVAGGTRRLVLLSGRGEEGARLAEQAVQESGADWTILRSSWFNQNFSEGAFLEQVRAGEVVLPAGRTPEPFVDVDDIADAAVAALCDRVHVGRLYELTGPRLLTFGEAVAEIGRAAGREIRYVPVSSQRYTSLLSDLQVPADVVDLLAYLFTEVLDGRNAHLTDGVSRVLGRAPRDFRDFARAAAAAGTWGMPAATMAERS